MIRLEVVWDGGVRVNTRLNQFVTRALRRAARTLQLEDSEITLLYTDAKRMKKLNSQFRGVHAPTDVLSFAMRESEAFPQNKQGTREYLGHIVLNMNDVRLLSRRMHTTQQRLARFLSLHGFLHLLGYDHGRPKDKELMRLLERLLTKGDVYYD